MPLRRSNRLAAKPRISYAERRKAPAPATKKPQGEVAAARQEQEKLRDRTIIGFIRPVLRLIEEVKGKDNKVLLTATLFRFLNDNAIHFVRRHGRFAAVCTAKAIELLPEGRIYPNLGIQLVAFLRHMGLTEESLKKLGA